MVERSDRGTAWRVHEEDVRQWAERGRMAWMVGQGVAEAIDLLTKAEGRGVEPGVLVARLEAVLAEGGFGSGMVTGGTGKRGRDEAAAAKVERKGKRKAEGGREQVRAPWRDGDRRLDTDQFLVMFLGAVKVRGTWASVAMGVVSEGTKYVLGLWRGCTADMAVARAVVENLAERGLAAERGLLVVHDGSQALDATVRRTWGARALVAHCQQSVAHEVLGHLAEKDRARVRQALQAAYSAPAEARGPRLSTLVEELAENSPGAAARLRRSVTPLCTVAELGLPARLEAHVHGIGPIRELAKAARCGPGTGPAAIAAVLPQLRVRMRRLIGAEALPMLAERLAARAAVVR